MMHCQSTQNPLSMAEVIIQVFQSEDLSAPPEMRLSNAFQWAIKTRDVVHPSTISRQGE